VSPLPPTCGWRALAAGVLAAWLATGCALLPADNTAPPKPATAAASDDASIDDSNPLARLAALVRKGLPTTPANEAAATAVTAAVAPSVDLVIDAPVPLRTLLDKYLDLSRLRLLRSDEVLEDSELARLVAAAPAQARDLLQTEGYFTPQVTVQREATAPGQLPRVRLVVVPGAQATVERLRVDTEGELSRAQDAGDSAAQAQVKALPAAAKLQAGSPFRNADWADTKQQLLARLRADGYAGARLNGSAAEVDAETHRVQLLVVLDSGPLYRAGPVLVEGLNHHDEATVLNLAGFHAGDALTEARLLDYQDRLQKAGLFERATVSFDPVDGTAAATPVRVIVSELPLQQATVGLGVSANTGPRASFEHTHRRPFGWAVSAYNKLEYGRDNQSWTGDFYSHPGEGFYRNLLGVQISRLRSDTDLVFSQRVRLGRTQDTPRIERLYFLELLRARQSDAAGTQSAEAVSGNYHVVWRDLDSVLLPTRGITLSLQGGAGQAFSRQAKDGPFTRAYGRLTGYLPLGSNWYGQARLEAGEIFKADGVLVPDPLGFRAGGDDSVRGYGYRTLAPKDSAGIVRSGLMLATASLELAHPVSPNLPAVWGAVFVDAGNAVDRWADYNIALGYGVGVRWRSPIGPLRVDLAWADQLHKFRLHMSVGIAF
jgi:translocation and assembly module TamA